MKTLFTNKITPSTIKLNPNKDEKLDSPTGYGQLPIDILENKKEILIVAPLAGVDLDNTEIVINEDTLTIRGKREISSEINNFKGNEYYVQECFWGEFSRSVILPPDTETQSIEASQENHILYIKIPKKPAINLRIVKIKSK